ncbi:MAG: ThuA domain-containing protein [Verrucomicrobiales bacterium]
MKSIFLFSLASFFAFVSAPAGELQLELRSQVETEPGSGRYHSITRPVTWEAGKTAVVVCDMWDDHYCRNAARRVAEMAPRMNRVLAAARKQGALIIHCPSGCMDRYEGTPQRKLAKEAPEVKTEVPLESWCYLDASAEPPMPVKIDQPCDDTGELRERKRFYTRQIDTLEIAEGDAITDSAEAYYLMKERGIENVVILGVHTNMCVLGRAFGIRQMVRLGQNVVLMRDMTDSMYNPREEPFVSQFTGNDLVFSHIERHWCPTVTSDQVLPDESEPFRFPGDDRKHLVIVTGEKEYETKRTLPAFAYKELGMDFKISLVFADEEKRNHFPGLGVLRDAELLLLSVRRRNPTPEQMALFREYLDAGKPLVGIRTASHPFHQRERETAPESLTEWRDFDPDILGGNYHGHLGGRLPTFAKANGEASTHPVLEGIDSRRFQVFGGLYQVRPLGKGTTVLLTGSARGEKETEPVAWTHTSPAGGRVFYTSLGHPYDFEVTNFRTLLRNAVYWAAGLVPEKPAGAADPLDDDC